MKKLLIICGPTATGKTVLALRLAKKFNGELVSADSRQVYRGMDIGTGKDLPRNAKCKMLNAKYRYKNKIHELIPYDMDGIPLWMVDVVNPDEEFSVAHYQCLATSVIEDIWKRGKMPIIVGGTGLYIASVLSPIETSHIPPNQLLRKTLERYSLEELQTKLKKDDPLAWNAMNESDRQNSRRLMRKIEIELYRKDKKMSTRLRRGFGGQAVRHKELNTLIIGLTAPYPVLYESIDRRVDRRVKEGIVEEIKTLIHKGYGWDLPSMNTFGYKEWKEYFKMPNAKCQMLNEKEFKNEIIQKWKWDEHGYARRQMTWFKKMKRIRWMDITQAEWLEKVEREVDSWYT